MIIKDLIDVFGLPRGELYLFGGVLKLSFTCQNVLEAADYVFENNIEQDFSTQSEIIAYVRNLAVPDHLPKRLYTTKSACDCE